jgi:hypothetical protein
MYYSGITNGNGNTNTNTNTNTNNLIQSDKRLMYFINNNPELIEEFNVWKQFMNSDQYQFTFEQTIDLCKINWKFEDPIPGGNGWEIRTKHKWLSYIREWNMVNRNDDYVDETDFSTYGYVAITYLYVSLPYNSLVRDGPACEYISEFLAKLINICMLHETGNNLICFKGYGMLTIDELEFLSYSNVSIDQQYNIARWFLMFLIFARIKNVDIYTSIASPMAMWSSWDSGIGSGYDSEIGSGYNSEIGSGYDSGIDKSDSEVDLEIDPESESEWV